jgi:hypothetical protein
MKKIKQLIYAAALLCSMAGCTKKDPLPDATQQGLNTFGCNIDGVAWIPTGTSGPGGTKPSRAALKQDGSFEISAVSPQYLCLINIVGSIITNVENYSLSNIPNSYGYFYNKETDNDFLTDKLHLGRVTVKIDSTNRIVSGTFSFQAKDIKSDKLVNITDGRFDLKY